VLLALARQLLYLFPEPVIAQHQAGVQCITDVADELTPVIVRINPYSGAG
jgi:hypothetical protein